MQTRKILSKSALAFVGALALSNVSCSASANRTASSIVARVGEECKYVPPSASVSGVPGSLICDVLSSLVSEVLGAFGTPATLAATVAEPLKSVMYRGVTLAVLPETRAEALRVALGDKVLARRFDRALGLP